jgi:hypothetical protein
MTFYETGLTKTNNGTVLNNITFLLPTTVYMLAVISLIRHYRKSLGIIVNP